MKDMFFIRKHVLHPEKWVPNEADKPRIVAELLDHYYGVLEICGEGEEADEAFKLYMQIANHTLAECRDDITEFFLDNYEAVHGEIEKYFTNEPQLIDLINLTLFPEWENVPVSEFLKEKTASTAPTAETDHKKI